MTTNDCPCISKYDSDNIRSALTTSRNVYRHIIRTLAIDAASPEYIALEEKANKFDSLIFQLEKITCKEDKIIQKDQIIQKDKIRQLSSEDIAKLPLKERVKIAKAIVGTISK